MLILRAAKRRFLLFIFGIGTVGGGFCSGGKASASDKHKCSPLFVGYGFREERALCMFLCAKGLQACAVSGQDGQVLVRDR